jgi:hypothetical protein
MTIHNIVVMQCVPLTSLLPLAGRVRNKSLIENHLETLTAAEAGCSAL